MLEPVLGTRAGEGKDRCGADLSDPSCNLAVDARGSFLTAKEYIDAIAQELGRVRGRGLLLSPADTQLALRWHAGRVPLPAVIAEVRKASRMRARSAGARGTAEMLVSLQALAPALDRLVAKVVPQAGQPDLRGQLRAAASRPDLAGRGAGQALADAADALLACGGGDGYWTEAVRALKAALRELPRSAALQAGAELRARIAPRPRAMSRRTYQRSLQLMLLSASSERLGVPPKPFLL